MTDKQVRQLTDKEIDEVSGGISSNFSTVTSSGNPTHGHGEGLTVVNGGGNAPPGQQY